MQELNQAEDIKQLTEKVKEQNVYFSLLKKEINRAIIGQEYMVDRLLIGLLGNGHVLLEGVPGLAKTLAIKTFQKRFTERFLEFSLRQICCLQM
jgi:MoxR-like ATPase